MIENEFYRKLLKNIVGGIAARGLNLLISLLMVPLMVGGLGPADYSLLAVILSATVLFSYADLGLGLAIVNHVSDSRLSQDQVRSVISRVWSVLLLVTLSIGLSILCYFIYRFASRPVLEEQEVSTILALMLTAMAIPSGIVQRTLFALNRNNEANVWQSITKLLSLFLVWLCALSKAPLLYYVSALLGPQLIVGWLNAAVFFWFQRRDLAPKFGLPSLRQFWLDLKDGLQFSILQFAVFAEFGIDNIVVATTHGTDSVFAYDIMARLFNYVPALVSVGAFPLWPALRNAVTSGNEVLFRRTLRNAELVGLALSVLVCCFLLLLNKSLIEVWIGRPFAGDQKLAFAQAAFTITTCLVTIQGMAMNAKKEISWQVGFCFIAVPLLIFLKYMLAHSFGVELIPLCTASYCLLKYVIFKRRLKLSADESGGNR